MSLRVREFGLSSSARIGNLSARLMVASAILAFSFVLSVLGKAYSRLSRYETSIEYYERSKSLPNVFGGVELLTLSACNRATGGSGAKETL